MKTTLLLETLHLNQGEVIAGWGHARLIRRPDGRHQLVGGTAEDQAIVREWIAMFAHDIVLDQPRPTLQRNDRNRDGFAATRKPSAG